MENYETLTRVIQARRSVYPVCYTGERVEDEVIHRILENANWAPNHKKTEPWRFHVFTKNHLKTLSEYVAQWYKDNTPDENFSQVKYDKTRNKPLRCSHVIAICMRRDPNNSLPEWEEIAAVSCAVQNIWLSCTAAGLGAYWSTPGSALNAESFLELKPGEKCLGWFYIGVPVQGLETNAKRGSIEAKVTWHH